MWSGMWLDSCLRLSFTKKLTLGCDEHFLFRLMVHPNNLTTAHLTHLRYVQLDFFTTFKSEYPKTHVALTTFVSLKPWWVRKLMMWITCYCHYHQELKKLSGGFNDIITVEEGHTWICNCNCSDGYVAVPNGESNLLLTRCNVAHKTYSGLIDLWTFLVYTQPIHSKWHNWHCLLRECQQCGVHKLAM
jgi:hypothetical protein